MARILSLVLSLLMVVSSHAYAVECSDKARNLDAEYEKTKLKVGSQIIEAYIADEGQKRSDGLMCVKTLPPNTGMLFAFEDERPLNFWMKNTLMPLSIGFFDRRGVLVDVQEMKTAPSMLSLQVPTYESRKPAMFALEMNPEWFSKNKVAKGARLQLHAPTRSPLLKQSLSKTAARQ